MSPEEALKFVTGTPPGTCLESRLGSLEPGKADFVVWSLLFPPTASAGRLWIEGRKY
jgi:imidazolonepropionase-like amidohydrolase